MSYKLIGAVCVVLACWFIGFVKVSAHRHEVSTLNNIIFAVRIMRNELQFRSTPLPQLCMIAADKTTGCVSRFLTKLTEALDSQICPDAYQCTLYAISHTERIPDCVSDLLYEFGKTLGQFDLPGQLDGLSVICKHANDLLEKIMQQEDVRMRSYQTLGVCAGIALVILLV